MAMWISAGKLKPTDEQRRHMDNLHYEKINRSDQIFVLDVGGYVSKRTMEKIQYARVHGRAVRLLSNECPGWSEDDCELWREEGEV